ncbi:MAG: hypothetical protein A3F09_03990 [Chlamydiae bacterium RIFCSPHIGHO2_12_FULL_49_11]|nr:MAG: hypothetical protein A3F09_03990 [Chlamydiae bacterium RIFCSPHIGHO2_12_FULL_49_11]
MISHSTLKKLTSPLIVFSIFVFLYLPIIVLIVYSFNSRSFPAPWKTFTFEWYIALFAHGTLWISFFNSFIVAFASTFLCFFMSMCMLFFLFIGGKIEKQLSLFYLNLVIPEAVLAVGLLAYFSLLHIPLGIVTVIFSHVVIGLGFIVPALYARFVQIDPRLTEASYVLGASSLQTFNKVIFPLLKPVLLSTSLMIFMISFDDFILSYFCAGTSFQTLSLFLANSLRNGISPVVNALATILIIATGCVTSFIFISSRKHKTRVFAHD